MRETVREVRIGRTAPRKASQAINKNKYFDVKDWCKWLLFVRDLSRNYSSRNQLTMAPVFVDRNPDNCFYVKVKLMDGDIVVLLGSGANSSLIGSENTKIISLCNLQILPFVSK